MPKHQVIMSYIMAQTGWTKERMQQEIELYSHIWVQCVNMPINNQDDLIYISDCFFAGCAYHDLDAGLVDCFR